VSQQAYERHIIAHGEAMLTRLLRWNRVSGKVLTLGPSTRRSIEKVQRTLKPQRLYSEVRSEGKGTFRRR